MKRKLGSSRTSSAKNNETLTAGFSIYDVPSANLEARHEAYTLLKHPDEAVRASAQRIIDQLTLAIRAMGCDDVGVLQVVDGDADVQLDAKPAA